MKLSDRARLLVVNLLVLWHLLDHLGEGWIQGLTSTFGKFLILLLLDSEAFKTTQTTELQGIIIVMIIIIMIIITMNNELIIMK